MDVLCQVDHRKPSRGTHESTYDCNVVKEGRAIRRGRATWSSEYPCQVARLARRVRLKRELHLCGNYVACQEFWTFEVRWQTAVHPISYQSHVSSWPRSKLQVWSLRCQQQATAGYPHRAPGGDKQVSTTKRFISVTMRSSRHIIRGTMQHPRRASPSKQAVAQPLVKHITGDKPVWHCMWALHHVQEVQTRPLP